MQPRACSLYLCKWLAESTYTSMTERQRGVHTLLIDRHVLDIIGSHLLREMLLYPIFLIKMLRMPLFIEGFGSSRFKGCHDLRTSCLNVLSALKLYQRSYLICTGGSGTVCPTTLFYVHQTGVTIGEIEHVWQNIMLLHGAYIPSHCFWVKKRSTKTSTVSRFIGFLKHMSSQP